MQLGVFRTIGSAENLIRRIEEAHMPVYRESSPLKTGDAVRIRVGPYKTLAEANASLEQVRKLGADGKTVRLN